MANKFSTVAAGPTFTARSYEETLSAPLALREQHDATISALNENLKKARNAEVDPSFQNQYNQHLVNLEGSIDNLVNNINTGGINANSALDDFSALKRKMDKDYSASGGIGKAIAMNRQIREQSDKALNHALAMKQSVDRAKQVGLEDAERYRKQFEGMSFDELAKTTVEDYSPTWAPEYHDPGELLMKVAPYMGKIREAATAQGLIPGTAKIVDGKLVAQDNTKTYKTINTTNLPNVEAAIAYISNVVNDPSSKHARSLVYNGTDPDTLVSGIMNLGLAMLETDYSEEDLTNTGKGLGGTGKTTKPKTDKELKEEEDAKKRILVSGLSSGADVVKNEDIDANIAKLERAKAEGNSNSEQERQLNELNKRKSIKNADIKATSEAYLDSEGKIRPEKQSIAKGVDKDELTRTRQANYTTDIVRGALSIAGGMSPEEVESRTPHIGNHSRGSNVLWASKDIDEIIRLELGSNGINNKNLYDKEGEYLLKGVEANNTIRGNTEDGSIVVSDSQGNLYAISADKLMEYKNSGNIDNIIKNEGDIFDKVEVGGFTEASPNDALAKTMSTRLKALKDESLDDRFIADHLATEEINKKNSELLYETVYVNDFGSSSESNSNSFLMGNNEMLTNLIINGSGGGNIYMSGSGGDRESKTAFELQDRIRSTSDWSNLKTKIVSFTSTGSDMYMDLKMEGTLDNKSVVENISFPLRKTEKGDLAPGANAVFTYLLSNTTNEEDIKTINAIRNQVITTQAGMSIKDAYTTSLDIGNSQQAVLVKRAADDYSGFRKGSPKGYEINSKDERINYVPLEKENYPFMDDDVKAMDHAFVNKGGKIYYTTRYSRGVNGPAQYMTIGNLINNALIRDIPTNERKDANGNMTPTGIVASTLVLNRFIQMLSNEHLATIDAEGDEKLPKLLESYTVGISELSTNFPTKTEEYYKAEEVLNNKLLEGLNSINIGVKDKTLFY